MWSSRLLSTALAALSLGAASASDVIELHKSDFSKTVNANDLMLVEFFAPWCGHCKALAPEYEAAATTLKDQNIPLAKVDCTAETELCQEQGVQGYPTLKVFRNGEEGQYGGGRKTDSIISYMRKQALPAVSEVDASNLETFSGSDRIVVVAFLDESDSANRKTFEEFAKAHRDDYVFGASTDPEALAAAKASPAPSIVLYKTFDEGRNDMESSGPLTSESIESFIKENSMPLMDEIGPENFINYAEAGIPIAYLFVEGSDASLVESIKPVARENKGKLNFVWIDATKFADHGKSLNLAGDVWPAFAIQNVQEGTKYPLDQTKVNVDSVGDFVKRFLDGKVQPSIKSEPVPSSQDGPVVQLVADEFDKIVFDDAKDVLVEFYAPWCGHCKRLAPIYDDLGSKYSQASDKIVIAKMDATANDIPPSAGFRVYGFPTIKFKPAGSKEFVDYEGNRSLESFDEFIAENSVNKPTPVEPATPEEAEQEESSPSSPSDSDAEQGHDEL